MMTEEMMAELERLKNENATLKAAAAAKKDGGITIKVGPKKGLCLYGYGRFPLNIYPTGAVRLASRNEVVKLNQFVIDHADELSFAKDGTDPEVAAAAKEAVLAAARKNLEE